MLKCSLGFLCMKVGMRLMEKILIHVLEFHSGTRDIGVSHEFNANNSRVCVKEGVFKEKRTLNKILG